MNTINEDEMIRQKLLEIERQLEIMNAMNEKDSKFINYETVEKFREQEDEEVKSNE